MSCIVCRFVCTSVEYIRVYIVECVATASGIQLYWPHRVSKFDWNIVVHH